MSYFYYYYCNVYYSQTPGCSRSGYLIPEISLFLIFEKSVVLGAGFAQLLGTQNSDYFPDSGFKKGFNAEFHPHFGKLNFIKIR